MNIRDSLQAFQRRLLIMVAALVVGVAGGWFSAPGESRRDTTFEATHTLLYEVPQGQLNQSYRIEQIAVLATSGNVPSRVANRLGLDRAEVRAAISAGADPKLATITISGQSPDPARAVSLADVTGEELRAELDERDRSAHQAELSRLTTEAETARKRLSTSKTPAEQSAARGPADTAERALSQFQGSGPPKPKLRLLETATATVVEARGVKVPSSKPVRAVLLGILGLLVGVLAAYALERLDNRIRSKRAAEAAFGAPVVAEVPVLRKSPEFELLTRTQPSSQFVEAYRGLRTYVALWAPPKAAIDDGHRVIVVTSPSPGEGKTTTVAHLAAMLAEVGRSVVVISGDLRRPRLHKYFERPGSPGLVDVLGAAPDAPTFNDLLLSTPVRGVRLVPSGKAIENPAPLFEHCGDLLRAVRGLADFVLVDSPPMLVANDAVDLARHADGVLWVARAGETRIEVAEQGAELLRRLEIPVVGTVLTGSESAPGASRYYSPRYYREPERPSRLRRRAGGGNGQHPTGKTMTAPEECSPALPTESVPGTHGHVETVTAAESVSGTNGHVEAVTAAESVSGTNGLVETVTAAESAWLVYGHAEAVTAAESAWRVNGHAATMTDPEESSRATESAPDANDS